MGQFSYDSLPEKPFIPPMSQKMRDQIKGHRADEGEMSAEYITLMYGGPYGSEGWKKRQEEMRNES